MTETTPQIDYTRIDFPSDPLTLKQLRTRGVSTDDHGRDLEIMHLHEEEFARLGFAVGFGNQVQIREAVNDIVNWVDGDGPYDEKIERGELQNARNQLADYYVRFGIAEGPETAQQLIHRLESAGAEQARQQLGKPRL